MWIIMVTRTAGDIFSGRGNGKIFVVVPSLKTRGIQNSRTLLLSVSLSVYAIEIAINHNRKHMIMYYSHAIYP
jgi:hypothetical protein